VKKAAEAVLAEAERMLADYERMRPLCEAAGTHNRTGRCEICDWDIVVTLRLDDGSLKN
jgi:hypothetical protein